MATTPNGTVYTVTPFTSSAGEAAWRAIPDAMATQLVPVVVFCHGNPGTDLTSADSQFQLSGYAAVRNWLMDNGWGWAECHGAGANWGGAGGRAAYEALYQDIDTLWDIAYNVILGRSMGALVAAYLASQSPVTAPASAGFISLSGTADLTNRYASASAGDKTNMNAAYGVTNDAEWRAAVASFDPMIAAASVWNQRNAIMQWDTGDTTVPYASNGQAWDSKYGPRLAIRRTFATAGGDHNSTPNLSTQQAATISFLDEVEAPVAPDDSRILELYYTLPDNSLVRMTGANR